MITERTRELIAIISNSGYVIFYTFFLVYGSKEFFEQAWNSISSVFFLFTLILYIILIPATLAWIITAYQKQQQTRYDDDLSLSISAQGVAKITISLTTITFFMTIGSIVILVVERISEVNFLFWITLILASIVAMTSFVVTINEVYLIILERKRKSDLSSKIEDARKQGFTSVFEKEKANSLGFEDSELWYDFLSSGYETKEEWDTARNSEEKKTKIEVKRNLDLHGK